jgi:hypothetical protein
LRDGAVTDGDHIGGAPPWERLPWPPPLAIASDGARRASGSTVGKDDFHPNVDGAAGGLDRQTGTRARVVR